jgi:hypothetical protein
MTVYAGGYNTNKLIVVPKGSNLPLFIEIQNVPLRGALLKKDSLLVVGCETGNLLLFNLQSPIAPSL